MYRVDLNSDLGESFGNYTLAANDEVLKHVSSANVACGLHAGDPVVMRHTVALAKQYGVGVGVHPSYPDLQGFGRRKMIMKKDELRDFITYQIGALYGFAKAAGLPLRHISAHGALGNVAQVDMDTARAMCEAVAQFDPSIRILYYGGGSCLKKVADEMGLPTVSMVFADRGYTEDGNLVPRGTPGDMITDPAEAVARVVWMIKEGKVAANTGKEIDVKADTVLVHGDGAHAVEFVLALEKAFAENGIQIQAFD